MTPPESTSQNSSLLAYARTLQRTSSYREAINIAREYLNNNPNAPSSLLLAIKEIMRESGAILATSDINIYDLELLELALECIENPRHTSKRILREATKYADVHYPKYLAEKIFSLQDHQPRDESYLRLASDQAENTKPKRPAIPQARDPLVSVILPVYKVKHSFLLATISSLIKQTYSNFEACIYFCDSESAINQYFLETISRMDNRIKLLVGNVNYGISGNSNKCLTLASGDFIALLDHDDDLSINALEECIEAVRSDCDVDFVYTDKDSMLEDGTTLVNPLFKPEWSPEIMYSANYLTHFNLIRRSLIEEIGQFDPETDGAQDWDIFFKSTEKARKIASVKKVCYHWRIHENSTSTGLSSKPYAHNAQLLAINNHLKRALNENAYAKPNNHGGFHITFRVKNLASSKKHLFIPFAKSSRDPAIDRIFSSGEHQSNQNFHYLPQVGKNQSEIFDILFRTAFSEQHREAESLVIFNADIGSVTLSALQEVAQWTSHHPKIGFCTGIIVDEDNIIKDNGLVVSGGTGNTTILFENQSILSYGIFGSPLWYRNVQAANHNFVSLDLFACRNILCNNQLLAQIASAPFPITELTCQIAKQGFRGLINPHAIVKCTKNNLNNLVVADRLLDPILHNGQDPYFHPHLELNLEIKKFADHHTLPRKDPVKNCTLAKQDYFNDAITLAEIIDITPACLHDNKQRPELLKQEVTQRIAAWFLPDFQSAFYGGMMTIFRLADYILNQDNVKSIFLICGNIDIEEKRTEVLKAFPSLAGCTFLSLCGENYMDKVPYADYGIATLWTTAYILASTNKISCKYYMIQDYEPQFYPGGTTSAQAELTYRFGFYGITNTVSLAEAYEQKFGGKAACLVPAIDTKIFYPNKTTKKTVPMRIFYYARPYTPRNCFELAAAAFRLLKSNYGSSIEIICAGSGWDPCLFGLDEVINSVGMLPYEQTAELYRSCHLGVSMMMTMHPSYLPLEMMACGTIVLANFNSANIWLLKDNHNCLLFEPSKSCMAARIAYAIDNYDKISHIRENAISTIDKNHSSWDQSLRQIADFMHSAGNPSGFHLS